MRGSRRRDASTVTGAALSACDDYPRGVAEFSRVSDNRLDRVLAAMIVGILALVVISFILYMLGSVGGWLTGPLATVVVFIPFFGLPLALIVMLVLVIRVGRRRMRESRGG